MSDLSPNSSPLRTPPFVVSPGSAREAAIADRVPQRDPLARDHNEDHRVALDNRLKVESVPVIGPSFQRVAK